MKKQTVTGRIYEIIFDMLGQNPKGVRWSELLREIEKRDRTLHPKTVNGCVWKLLEKYPDKVYKPEKGLFRLTKFK